MKLRDDLELRRRVAEEAARAAGEVHLRHRGSRLERTVHGGDRTDYATLADFESQAAVREVVARYFPHERVIGEEDESWDGIGDLIETGCWFTDPLDGTLDFVHGSPAFSAIVTFVEGERPQACAIYFPVWQEMYSGAYGMGATLNGAPLCVSGLRDLQGAVVAMPYRGSAPDRAERIGRRIAALLPHVETVRLPGAPSLIACGVVAGYYDLFPSAADIMGESGSRPFRGQPWETAAFVLLVEEAGGAVASISGGPPDLLDLNMYAASRELIDAYLALISKA